MAELARLELTVDEIERMTKQLDVILSYVAKLDELDTDGVAATTHTQSITNAFREDEVQQSLPRDKSLENGPLQNNDAFVVPRVIS